MKVNQDIASIENHRIDRERGAIVYPVYSRRSEGLSIGINLFPDKKVCSFNCPYCEIFPFETDIQFSIDVMQEALIKTIQHARNQNISIRDICFSGNGEPTMSPYFQEAMNQAAIIRDDLAPEAKLVVITNGTMLLHENMFDYLVDAATGFKKLNIWLKIDSGTTSWYHFINRSQVSFNHLIKKIKLFAAKAPFTIQTMICSIDEQIPSSEEISAWINLISELSLIAKKSYGITNIQIYGKARPAPEDPKAKKLPDQVLQNRAKLLQEVLQKNNLDISIKVYP
jgi:histidinol dehydrogenase